MKKLVTVCLVLAVVTSIANASWETFVIRENAGVAPTITDVAGGYKEFDVSAGSQKAAWSTNAVNGMNVGDIVSLSIDHDPATPVGTYGPYFNIWVSDGVGGYAVLANEPSHTTEYTAYGETAHNMTWDGALKNATCWIYEVNGTQGFKLPDGTIIYSSMGAGTSPAPTFNDFAGYLIETPDAAYIAANFPAGSGAPRELGTNVAYGFNWIFGDTADNYANIFTVTNPTVVPEPATMVLLGLGGLLLRRKK